MRSVLLYIGAVAGLLLAAYVALVIHGREELWESLAETPDPGAYDFAAPVRSGKPNDVLICPAGACDAALPNGNSPVYAADPDAVFAVAKEVLAGQGIDEAIEEDAAGRRISAIARTPMMRFPDRLTLMVSSDPVGNAVLWVYSASRIGHSDLGTNRRRVERLIAAIDGRFSRAGPSGRG